MYNSASMLLVRTSRSLIVTSTRVNNVASHENEQLFSTMCDDGLPKRLNGLVLQTNKVSVRGIYKYAMISPNNKVWIVAHLLWQGQLTYATIMHL
jgi:hypothetical protein